MSIYNCGRTGLLSLIALGCLGLLVTGPALAAEHFVNTNGLVFEPADLTINVGDTVTWINADNGFHNVVADDGSFTSGPPSNDSWQYSHTFTTGGSYGYHCEVHVGQGMTGTITVQGVFADGMEGGTAEAWSEVEGTLPICHCYFSSDCADGGDFCNWGNLTVEDNCLWAENKPDGVPGAGCDVDFPGVDWVSGICDGICTPSGFGSDLGFEDPKVLTQAIQLWAEAMLTPAEAGGGPIDPDLTEQILELPFQQPLNGWILGRQIGDMLAIVGIADIERQYCHHESHPGEDPPLVVDISEDSCLQAVGRLAIDTLLAEVSQAGAGEGMLEPLREACPDNRWQSLAPKRCPVGSGTLDCLTRRIAKTAEFLTTPRQDGGSRLFTTP